MQSGLELTEVEGRLDVELESGARVPKAVEGVAIDVGDGPELNGQRVESGARLLG